MYYIHIHVHTCIYTYVNWLASPIALIFVTEMLKFTEVICSPLLSTVTATLLSSSVTSYTLWSKNIIGTEKEKKIFMQTHD